MFQHKVHNKGSSLGESVSSYGITGTLDGKTAGWSRAMATSKGTPGLCFALNAQPAADFALLWIRKRLLCFGFGCQHPDFALTLLWTFQSPKLL